MIHFILLNGPPRSGKTIAARLLSKALTDRGATVHMDAFAAPMKNFIASGLGERYHDLRKDDPHPVLRGSTPRQFLIGLSEDYLKNMYGTDVFGRMLYHRACRTSEPPDFVLIDDSGFAAEAGAVGEPHNRTLLKLIRPGCDFSGDSRSYWAEPSPGYNYEVHNIADIPYLTHTMEALAGELMADALFDFEGDFGND